MCMLSDTLRAMEMPLGPEAAPAAPDPRARSPALDAEGADAEGAAPLRHRPSLLPPALALALASSSSPPPASPPRMRDTREASSAASAAALEALEATAELARTEARARANEVRTGVQGSKMPWWGME
jgi:hypothetical protein